MLQSSASDVALIFRIALLPWTFTVALKQLGYSLAEIREVLDDRNSNPLDLIDGAQSDPFFSDRKGSSFLGEQP
jgi:DNA-binding transcriptional MerR regulator